jgi:hypothetical protein
MHQNDPSSPGTPEHEHEHESTAEIRGEIEQTRAEMSGTIDAIQEKLDPKVLTEQAKETAQDMATKAIEEIKEHAKEAIREATEQAKEAVREATVGKVEHMATSTVDTAKDVGTSIVDRIKANPLPAALAGLSLGWLFMKGSNGSSSSHRSFSSSYRGDMDRRSRYGYESGYQAGYGSDSGATYEHDEDQGFTDKMGDMASRTQEKAAHAMSAAGDRASDMMSSAGDRASDMMDTATSTAGDVTSTLVETIRQNPIPAALAGIGLGWLYVNRSSSSSSEPSRYAYSGGHTWQGASGGYSSRQTAYGGATAYEEPGTMDRMVDKAQGAAGTVADKVQGAAGTAKDTVHDAAGSVVDTVQGAAGSVADTAQYQASRAKSRVQDMMQESPLMAGALAVAVGAAAGLALPTTDGENEMFGSSRDKVMHQLKGTAKETMDKVQRVADQAQSTIAEHAEKEGLTASKS